VEEITEENRILRETLAAPLTHPQYQKNSDIGDQMLKKTSPAASLSPSLFFSMD
jgi:hypothetical protein